MATGYGSGHKAEATRMSGETGEVESGWTVDTLRQHLAEQMAAQNAAWHRLLAEMDLRYQQRYDAQQKALEAALLAQEKAVQTALISAEKAVTKAETAAEKRFECVSIDTPVLCADLIWRPAGDLVAGDELIAFDEESPSRRGRRFRRATVTENSLVRDALLLVTTPVGAVRCNYNHLWLAKPGYRENWRWVRADRLKPGWALMHSVDVWDVDRSWEGGWLAGMYDGEGCLCFDKNGSVQLTVTQRESETATRLSQALKARLNTFVTHRQEKAKPGPEQRLVGGFTTDLRPPGTPSTVNNTVPFYHFIVSARSSVLKIIGSVRPPRLLIKSDEIWDGKPIGGMHRDTIITSVEPAGTGMIARLSTSTRTYIAGGFAVHNSVNEFRATLADQASQLMPRVEAEARIATTTEKISELGERAALLMPRAEAVARADTNAENINRLGADLNEVSARITAIESRTGGHQDSTKNLVTIAGLGFAFLSVVVTVVGLYLAFHK